MKKLFLFFAISLYFCIPSFSTEDGFMEDENETIQEPVFKLLEKEKIETENAEIITTKNAPVKLNIERLHFLDSYKEFFSAPDAKVDLYSANGFTLFSDGKKELSDYMTDNFKSTMNASYIVNETWSLRAGHEIWYVNPNASVGARKFYFNPRLNLTKNCYFDYVSKYNQTSKNIEQEVGFNYKPKLFREAASFGIKASTVIDSDTNEFKSKKIKFSTDFYL